MNDNERYRNAHAHPPGLVPVSQVTPAAPVWVPPSPPNGIDARLLDALTKSHLALSDLGSRIQCTAGGFWQVRHPHSEMQAVIAAVDEAMLLYHAVLAAGTTAPAAEVIEIQAETILRVVDYCDGPDSVLDDCDAVRAFIAKATA